MITLRKLRNYANRLYDDSPVFSGQENIAMRINNLLDAAHPVESVRMILEKTAKNTDPYYDDVKQAAQEAIHYIDTGKKKKGL